MGHRIPYLVGAVARVHILNGSFPHQNVVFFSPFQHLHVKIPLYETILGNCCSMAGGILAEKGLVDPQRS